MSVGERRAAFLNRYQEFGFTNATQAAIDAGYAAPSAKVTASRILASPSVREEVERRKAAIARGVERATEKVAAKVAEKRLATAAASRDRVAAELKRLATSSVEHYDIGDNGKVVLRNGAPAGAMRAVSSVKVRKRVMHTDNGTIETTDTEFKLWNKNNALQQIREMEAYDVPPPTAKGALAGAVIELHGGPMGFELRVSAGAAVRVDD